MGYKSKLATLLVLGFALIIGGITCTVIGMQRISDANALTPAEKATQEKIDAFSTDIIDFASEFGLSYDSTKLSSLSSSAAEGISSFVSAAASYPAYYLAYVLAGELTPATIGDSEVVTKISEVPLSVKGANAFPRPNSYRLNTLVTAQAILNTSAATNPSGVAAPIAFTLKANGTAAAAVRFDRLNIPFTKPNVSTTAYCDQYSMVTKSGGCSPADMEAYCQDTYAATTTGVYYRGEGCLNSGADAAGSATSDGIPCGLCFYTGYLSSYCAVIRVANASSSSSAVKLLLGGGDDAVAVGDNETTAVSTTTATPITSAESTTTVVTATVTDSTTASSTAAPTTVPPPSTSATPSPYPPLPNLSFEEDPSMHSCHYPFTTKKKTKKMMMGAERSAAVAGGDDDDDPNGELELQRYLLPYRPTTVLFQVLLNTDPAVQLEALSEGTNDFGPNLPPAESVLKQRWRSDDGAIGILIVGLVLLLTGIICVIVGAITFQQEEFVYDGMHTGAPGMAGEGSYHQLATKENANRREDSHAYTPSEGTRLVK